VAPITERCGTVSYQGSPNNYYCGSFSSKRRHGFGIRTFGDGSTYLGDYRLDGVTGVGYWLEKNSSRYLGDIVLKQKEGNGYFLWTNG
jgi:1-phosphatidylinositol-4-phosphate 5-kinase